MTYTFKLARRLAVSRTLTVLPVLLVLAGCYGDATAPESPTETPTPGSELQTEDLTPVAVQVNPHRVTLETNQLIQFRAHGRTSAGDSVAAAVSWNTSGGTILPDGRFSAAAIGTFTVVGVSRVRGNLKVDSSLVTVVRRRTNLVAIEVSPTSVTLTPGVPQTFSAVGRLRRDPGSRRRQLGSYRRLDRSRWYVRSRRHCGYLPRYGDQYLGHSGGHRHRNHQCASCTAAASGSHAAG